MTTSRRLSREIALKTLYQVNVGGLPPDEALSGAFEANRPDPNDEAALAAWGHVQIYAAGLVRGVERNKIRFDNTISSLSHEWSPDRMPTADRIILHIALQELEHPEDVPIAVVIDEAVEMAQMYSTDESGRFVNGVLGAFVRRRDPKPVSPPDAED